MYVISAPIHRCTGRNDRKLDEEIETTLLGVQ